jgi:phosphatidate cytidylyltransferase
VHHLYIREPYQVPFLGTVAISKAQLISCVFAAFASLISPFLGFLFSGLKRAYHAKDFSGTLPGHGGFADRMDCITLMVLFSYFMLS